MSAFTVLCGILLISSVIAAPQRSNPDVQTRDAVDDFQKWSEKQQQERRNSNTESISQTRVQRAAPDTQQREDIMLGDQGDLPTSLIIGAGDRPSSQVTQTVNVPSTQRLEGTGIGDAISNAGSEILGHFTTEPPSFWDRLGDGIKKTYNKAVQKAEEVGESIRETVG